MDILDMFLQIYILFLTLLRFSQFTTQPPTTPPSHMQSLCQRDTGGISALIWENWPPTLERGSKNLIKHN